jgi:hypothetical protein
MTATEPLWMSRNLAHAVTVLGFVAGAPASRPADAEPWFALGTVEILRHDGHGKLTFQTRPFVVMVDHAFAELGTIT